MYDYFLESLREDLQSELRHAGRISLFRKQNRKGKQRLIEGKVGQNGYITGFLVPEALFWSGEQVSRVWRKTAQLGEEGEEENASFATTLLRSLRFAMNSLIFTCFIYSFIMSE